MPSVRASEIFRLPFASLIIRCARRQVLETRAGFKNPEILIRSVSRHRLEDQSRNIRVVVAGVAARTAGGAIYRRLRGSSASEGLFHNGATAMRFIFLNQQQQQQQQQRQSWQLLIPLYSDNANANCVRSQRAYSRREAGAA
jgi:hypothetical protein